MVVSAELRQQQWDALAHTSDQHGEDGLRRKDLTPTFAAYVAEHVTDHELLESLSGNPACPPHLLEKFLYHDSKYVVQNARANPNLPYHYVAGDPTRALLHPGVDAALVVDIESRLGEGVDSSSAHLWGFLAQCQLTSEAGREALLQMSSDTVFAALLTNPSTTQDQADRILSRTGPQSWTGSFERRWVRNPNASTAWLHALVNGNNELAIAFAGSHPNLSLGDLERCFVQRHLTRRRLGFGHVAANPNLNAAQLNLLASSLSGGRSCLGLMTHPQADDRLLERTRVEGLDFDRLAVVHHWALGDRVATVGAALALTWRGTWSELFATSDGIIR